MPSPEICNLSGIVLNQNQVPGSGDSLLPVGWTYQDYYLPDLYQRGSEGEAVSPPLSGFSLFVGTSAAEINVDWVIQYRVFGFDWVTVASGTAIQTLGAHNRVWIDAMADTPVNVDEVTLVNRWRIGFKINSGITKVWGSKPNPLATPHNCKAYGPDGYAPLTLSGQQFSYMFRIYGLTADAGTDFLGNNYRSSVIFNDPANASTLDNNATDKYWLSKPNPSRFAIENLYYDMRPTLSVPAYGRKNLVKNPSFETNLTYWTDNSTGTTPGNMARTTDWLASGSWSAGWVQTTDAGLTFPGFQSALIPVSGGKQYSCRLDAKTVALPQDSDGFKLLLRWWNISGSAIGDTTADMMMLGEDQLVTTGIAPAAAVNVTIIAYSQSTDSSYAEFYIDAVLLLQGTTSDLVAYFDGDTYNCQWGDTFHNSTSWEILDADPLDNEVVIDRVLVDPLTPGIYFSVYYTSDGEPAVDVDDWDHKLWTRVPQTFHSTKRETHVLPEPIRAKYIKIEFTHLQAKSYSPGNFAKPVLYKKHPKWVLDYFLARVQSANDTSANLDVGRVAVIFDAYTLAYNYYLDDINQAPNRPFEITPQGRAAVNSFLTTADDLSDKIDPVMLDKIKTALQPYRNHISTFVDPDTLLGGFVQSSISSIADYPVERAATTYNDVQQLRNTDVAFENGYPVMFFYLQCRHKYRVVQAAFDKDKAYFAGIKEIAFTRENYTTAYDTDLYIEPHGDMLNTERNDFEQAEGSLVV